MNHTTGERLPDLVPLYALGSLEPDEMQEVEQGIKSGGIPVDLVSAMFKTIAFLAESETAAFPEPRRGLRTKILSAVGDEPAVDRAVVREQVFVMENDGEWVDMMPGIRIKILWTDKDVGRITFLARLEPGANYPSHRHRGVEECLVIEGDLRMDETVLHAGDYTVAFADNVHTVTRSEDGCLLFLRSPMNDEFLTG